AEAFGLPQGDNGIISSGRALAGATLVHDHGSGIDIVTPSQRREGDWLAELIAQLRTDHKIILVDLPAVMEDKRSVLLSRATDTALLVVPSDGQDQYATNALIPTVAPCGRNAALAVGHHNPSANHGWKAVIGVVGGLGLRARGAESATV